MQFEHTHISVFPLRRLSNGPHNAPRNVHDLCIWLGGRASVHLNAFTVEPLSPAISVVGRLPASG